jgi:hypothetical protein
MIVGWFFLSADFLTAVVVVLVVRVYISSDTLTHTSSPSHPLTQAYEHTRIHTDTG